jgi:hypothetical protein
MTEEEVHYTAHSVRQIVETSRKLIVSLSA